MGLEPTAGALNLCQQFNEAKEKSGRSRLSLLMQALQLRFGETHIGFSEYFGFCLYDKTQVSAENITTFTNGNLAKQIWEGLNPPEYWGLVIDKVYYQILMERMGFRQPKLIALYDNTGMSIPDVNCFDSKKSLADFLRNTDSYPMFGKPSDSYRSAGAMGLQDYQPDFDTVALRNGESISVENLVSTISKWHCYLFQDCLIPVPVLRDLSGKTLSTLRLVVARTSQGPEVFRAVWKIPTGKNMADNFWRAGNSLAHIDTQNRSVYAMIQSVGNGYRSISSDEKLGARFISSTPPQYDEAVKLALEASNVFPMFAYQAWDIALTDEGPVALELNHNGDIDILQMGARIGILDTQFRNLLAERNITLKKPR